MTRARDIANLVDANGDIVAGALDNVPASNDASALTTGTLAAARLPSSGVDASSLTTGTLPAARLAADSVDNTILDLASDFAGIHFGGTGSNNQFNDYETGTWDSTVTYDNTVTDTSPDQTFTITGAYVKSGEMCLAVLPTLTRSGTFGGNNAIVSKFTLPFTAGSTYANGNASFEFYNVRGRYGSGVMTQGALTGSVGAGSNNCGIIFMDGFTTVAVMPLLKARPQD